MAMTNTERQRRWLEKNRALHNLRRRNARSNLLSADGDRTSKLATLAADSDSYPEPTKLPFETKKVGEFRMLVMPETHKEEATMPVVKPKVFLNDHGAVISERTWNILQEKKRIAKENGYEFDPQ